MTLDELFNKYGSDKGSNHHNYSPIYTRILDPIRHSDFTLLELGIGGYHYEDRGGGDLKAFADYLPNAKIIGVDIYKKEFLNVPNRIETHIGDQNDRDFFLKLIMKGNHFDIIIDDASHNNQRTIRSFEILFPLLNERGYYIVEDVHTSYWDSEEYQGDDGGDPYTNTTMNFFKRLTDVLNFEHISNTQNYGGLEKYEDMIASISFYKELIVIEKK